MLIKFFHERPKPPLMSRDQYRKFRSRLAAAIVIWLLGFVIFAAWWDALPLVFKVAIGALLVLVSPDVDAVEQLLTPYSKYEKEQ